MNGEELAENIRDALPDLCQTSDYCSVTASDSRDTGVGPLNWPSNAEAFKGSMLKSSCQHE